MKKLLLALIVLAGPAASPSVPDRVELVSGIKYEGRMVRENPDSIRFEVHLPGGGKAQIDIPSKNVHALTVRGKRRVLNAKGASRSRTSRTSRTSRRSSRRSTPAAGAKPSGAVRSKAQVLALVNQMGRTPPDWYGSTPLNYPKSIDLTWKKPPPNTPWNPNKNIGQFIWSVINENESRWKQGVRFLHHVLTVNKDNPAVITQTMDSLGTMYHNLHEDWARAAFWWDKAGKKYHLGLAHCYYKLGSKQAAVEILNRFPTDYTRHCGVARLWSEMGETDKALKIALATARNTPDVGYLAAGDICRVVGRYKEALGHYQKVVDASSGGRDIKQARARAQASITAIRLVEALDLRRIPDGAYQADSYGYSGQVYVEVAVSGGRIGSVKVTRHTEKQYYSAISDTCKQLVEKQGAKGVDATSAATITSEAIINASLKALSKGMK